jgi:serine/threonine protein phosphatase PrpC
MLLLAVFDGHGVDGAEVAEYCASYAKHDFLINTADYAANPQATLFNLIKEIDEHICEIGRVISTTNSGTAAVFLLYVGNELVVANVGDSKAILGIQGHQHRLEEC